MTTGAGGSSLGVRLFRTEENVAEIASLARLIGEPAGVDAVLNDLDRQGRRSRGFFGRAVDQAFTWDAHDRATRRWWPQGITTSADASDTEDIGGRRVLAITWYSKPTDGVTHGSRITFLDLDTLRYRHVLLVVPRLDRDGQLELAPLKVHAGGIVWWGPYLHIAATSRGIMTCRVDDILRIPDRLGRPQVSRLAASASEVASFGYRYVLPLRFTHRASTARGHEKLRYSFLSLDRSQQPPELICGEYGRGDQSTRVAHFELDRDTSLPRTSPEGWADPIRLEETGVRAMQGVAVARGRHHLTVSHGPVLPGSMVVGHPGAFRRRWLATPIGPEDISYWPSTDRLWSVTEYPHLRWIVSMRRSWFD